jgi:hypothetical protein
MAGPGRAAALDRFALFMKTALREFCEQVAALGFEAL